MEWQSNVAIVTATELRSQGVPYDHSVHELLIGGKRFKKQLSLRKLFQKVALEHCQREVQAGYLCVLIEDNDYWTVWRADRSKPTKQISQHTAIARAGQPQNHTPSPAPSTYLDAK